ncbi:hypothetical protein RB195_019499 [Necator americanus]|uniref:Acyltransferase n=1 Tax=Necator americanus TaxID=51031 RepID=A0ABR1CHB6_NECAM
MCGSIAYEYLEGRQTANTYQLLSHQDNDEPHRTTRRVPQKRAPALHDTAFTTAIFFTLLQLVLVSPDFVSDDVARIFSTLLAGITIYVNSNSLCLANPVIVYCGDISYVLYLIHWPVIVAARYYTDTQQLSIGATIVVLLVSFGVSIVVHHSAEKFFIASGVLPALICVAACYIFVFGTETEYLKSPPLESIDPNSSKIKYAIEWNLREDRKVFFQLPCDADNDTQLYTKYKGEPQLRCVAQCAILHFTLFSLFSKPKKGNGTANVLLIGNSIAYRAYPLIHDIMKGRFSTLRLFARSSCPALSNWCKEFSSATRSVVQHVKPDILMNIHHSTHPPFVAPITDLKSDLIFNQFQANVDFFSKYSKYIVIDMPYYKYPVLRTGAVLAKRFQQGLPPGDDLVVTWEQYINQTQYHRRRISSIKCKKCIINDVAD